MYCSKCNVTVEGNIPVCPLCHSQLEYDGGEQIFPETKKPKKDIRKTFTNIYSVVASIIVIVFSIIDYFFIKNFMYVALTVLFLLNVYTFVRFTIFGGRNIGGRLFVQSTFLSLFSFLIQFTFKTVEFTFSYVIPIINIITLIGLIVYCLTETDKFADNILSVLLHSIVGVIPVILYFALSNVLTTVITPAICASVSSATLILTIALFWKVIKLELKKIFSV